MGAAVDGDHVGSGQQRLLEGALTISRMVAPMVKIFRDRFFSAPGVKCGGRGTGQLRTVGEWVVMRCGGLGVEEIQTDDFVWGWK